MYPYSISHNFNRFSSTFAPIFISAIAWKHFVGTMNSLTFGRGSSRKCFFGAPRQKPPHITLYPNHYCRAYIYEILNPVCGFIDNLFLNLCKSVFRLGTVCCFMELDIFVFITLLHPNNHLLKFVIF